MILLYLDEDSLSRALVQALRRAGFDVLTAAEAGRRGLPDEDQLTFAASENRAVYSSNRADFARLHTVWLETRRHHAGIILLRNQQTGIGVQVSALVRLSESVGDVGLGDRLEFLANWIA